jgi:peroxiredoxin
MKRIIFLALIAAAIIGACSAPAPLPAFTLTVNAEDAEGKLLELQKRVGGEWVTIDSMVMLEGEASFTGTIQSPNMYYLSLQDSRGSFGFFVEASDINIQLDPQNMRSSEIVGSATHDRYAAFMMDYDAFNDRLRSIYQEYNAANAAGNKDAMEATETAYNDTQRDQSQFLVDYVNNNGGDIVAHFVLFRNSYMFDLEELEGMVVNFDPGMNSVFADELHEKIIILKRVDVGQPYVDFTQESPDGQMIALSDAVGSKLLLVDFWASWCGPCRVENPNIVAVYQDYKDKGFDVFGVSLDTDKDKWIEAIAADELTWHHVSDLAGWGNQAGKLYGVQSIPHSVLLDENGIIIAKNLRAEGLREAVAEVLD